VVVARLRVARHDGREILPPLQQDTHTRRFTAYAPAPHSAYLPPAVREKLR
jgi:hypothetical protein